MNEESKKYVMHIGGANLVGMTLSEALKKSADHSDALVSPISLRADQEYVEGNKKLSEVLIEWDRAHRERSQAK